MDEFTEAYTEAALWSTNDESTSSGGFPLDANYSIDDIHPDTIAKMVADCEKFQKDNADLLIPANCFTSSPVAQQAGHDFWLTRHHHGAGFWEDGDWEEQAGEKLTEAAQKYKEFNLYIGDDGKIHGA